MDYGNGQAGQFLQNKDIRELIDLLKQNNPSQGKEYAALLWQVEDMSRLLDKALRELQEVRTQLGGQKESGTKQAVTKAVGAVEGRIGTMRMAVSDMKERIVVAPLFFCLMFTLVDCHRITLYNDISLEKEMTPGHLFY